MEWNKKNTEKQKIYISKLIYSVVYALIINAIVNLNLTEFYSKEKTLIGTKQFLATFNNRDLADIPKLKNAMLTKGLFVALNMIVYISCTKTQKIDSFYARIKSDLKQSKIKIPLSIEYFFYTVFITVKPLVVWWSSLYFIIIYLKQTKNNKR